MSDQNNMLCNVTAVIFGSTEHVILALPTLLQYCTAVRCNVDINWQCENCANPETSVDDLMDVADQDANLSDLVDALSNS